MPAKAGTAYVEIEGDFSALNRQVASHLGKISKSGKAFGKRLGGSIRTGIGTGISAGAPIAAVGLAAVTTEVIRATKGWSEHQAVVRRTQAVIKSTGNLANTSAKHIGALSDAIERQTGVDNDLVQSGANLLLTFTNVRNGLGKTNKIFDQATSTVVNMSKALGQDTKSSAIQLGKALNDPVKGITALSRVGVSFTEQQKKQIKALVASGKTMEAQKIILRELGKEFPKVKATPIEQLRTTFRNLEDTIGKNVLPIVNKFVQRVNPAFQHVASTIDAAFSDKRLSFGEKIEKIVRSAKHWFGPFADGLIDALKEAHIGGAVNSAIKTATPVVLDVFKDVGTKAASAVWEGFKAAPLWAKVGGGAFLAQKLGLTGPIFKTLTGMLTGKGTLLSKASPMPVYVTNVGALGGAPGVPGASGTTSKGKPKLPPVLTGAAKIVGAVAAADVVIRLVDSKGDLISSVVNTAHDLTFGLVPKIKPLTGPKPGTITAAEAIAQGAGAGGKGVGDLNEQIGKLASTNNVTGLQRVYDMLNKFSKVDPPQGVAEARERVQSLIKTTKESRVFDDFRARVDSTHPKLSAFARDAETSKTKLSGLKQGTEDYSREARHLRGVQHEANLRLIDMINVAPNVKQALKEMGLNFMSLGGDVSTAASYIVAATNQVLSGLGADTIKFSLKRSKEIDKAFKGRAPGGGHQRGGAIFGTGLGDKIPALLEPGEYVVNRRAVGKVGKAALDKLNFGDAPRFQTGGIVPIPGQPGEFIAKSILSDVLALIRRYKVRVTDGYAATGHAAGGEHPLGLAVDLVPAAGGSWNLVDQLAHWAEPQQNRPRFPFRWVGYDGDPGHGRGNHLHLSWLHDRSAAGAIGVPMQIPALGIEGPDGMLKDIVRGAERTMRHAANAYIEDQMASSIEGAEPGGTAPGAASRTEMVRWATEALKRTRIFPATAANIEKILTLAKKESGWVVNALNTWDSNAQAGNPSGGLMQVTLDKVGGSFERLYNPVENIVASIRYQKQRYGELVTHSPYSLGGIVDSVLAMARGGNPKKEPKRRGAAYYRNIADAIEAAATPKEGHRTPNQKVKQRIAKHLAKIGFTAEQAQLDALANKVAIDDDYAQRLSGIANTDAIQAALDAELTRRGATTDMTEAQLTALFPVAQQDAMIQSMLPRIQGGTQVDWLNTELSDLLGERNFLIDEPPILERMRRQVEKEIADLKTVVKRHEKIIARYVRERERVSTKQQQYHDALRETREEIRRERGKKKPSQARLTRLHQREERYRANEIALREGTHDDLVRLGLIAGKDSDPFKHSHYWYNDNLAQERADNAARNAAIDTLTNSSDDGVVSLPNIKEAYDGVADSLSTIHGLGSPMTKFFSSTQFPIGTLGGTILGVQQSIDELLRSPLRANATAEGAAAGEDQTQQQINDLLKELLRQANLRYAVSQAQYDALRDYPFGGSFGAGGTVPGPVGAPRMIVAHGGETVMTADESRMTSSVHLHFAPGTEWLRDFVDVRVQKTTRTQARSSDRRLPGQAGVLR